MRKAEFTIIGISPYSQSGEIQSERNDKETWPDWEKRCWRERIHSTGNGIVFIPPMGLKQCLDAAAKFISMQIPGKGKSTYTKHFKSGLLCTEPIELGIPIEKMEGKWFSMHADGVRGSGKRVPRCYPEITEWRGEVNVLLLSDAITDPVFEIHLKQAGQFIGLGRFRPENGGFYGRFTYENLRFSEVN